MRNMIHTEDFVFGIVVNAPFIASQVGSFALSVDACIYPDFPVSTVFYLHFFPIGLTHDKVNHIWRMTDIQGFILNGVLFFSCKSSKAVGVLF